MRNIKGFTLIELMIVVVIIAILSSIAIPMYRQYIIRANRSAAQSQMLDISNREQQFLLADRVYAASGTLVTSGYALPTEVSARYGYDVTVNNTATPPTFLITFRATGPQASDGDLTLNSVGVKAPVGKW